MKENSRPKCSGLLLEASGAELVGAFFGAEVTNPLLQAPLPSQIFEGFGEGFHLEAKAPLKGFKGFHLEANVRRFQGLSRGSQGQNLDLTVLSVPCSFDSGKPRLHLLCDSPARF